MKKYLAIILGVLFVLSFAASAFAIHSEIPSETQAIVAKGTTQITLGGELRTRGWYEKNIDATKMPTSTNSEAWYDERVRLSVEANVAPALLAMYSSRQLHPTQQTKLFGATLTGQVLPALMEKQT